MERSAASRTTSIARFRGILTARTDGLGAAETEQDPEYFRDLNLDQVVSAIDGEYKHYRLAPFYRVPLSDRSEILYRQAVMRDLELPAIDDTIQDFAQQMRSMRLHRERAKASEYDQEKQRWFLNGAKAYCDGIGMLAERLPALDLRSAGLQGFREYVVNYAASPAFQTLATEATRLVDELSAVRYALVIRDGAVTVQRYEGEPDYTTVVERLFERFRAGATRDYRTKFQHPGRLDHVEAQVLERVAWLHPDTFRALESFVVAHDNFVDEDIARFDRDIQFYVAYLSYIAPLRRSGLPFCYPTVSDDSKDVEAKDAFDLALAAALVREGGAVVTNGFSLRGAERIIVVTGPNHGGKTTFARMFGQLHHLAALGCPVPGKEAKLFLCDQLFTQFERAESIENLRGKLQDDLVRVRRILDRATPRSVVVMNEVFSSTTVQDAVFLSRKVMAELSRLDLLAVCVTFLDELASFDEKTVSMVSTVDPRDPAIRTFKLERIPANGVAYALAIAEKHRVTYDWLKRRLESGQ